MITRRTFLQASAAAAAGLILPSWLVQAENYIDIEARPFLESPTRSESTIYAVNDGNDYYLALGKPLDDVPKMTWRELFASRFSCDSFEEYFGTDDPEELKGYHLDDLAPEYEVWDYWIAEGCEYAQAHDFLKTYDLGFDFNRENGIGEIDFVEGPCPGNDSKFVTVPDHLSLSLLQKRLNQIDGTIKVALHSL